MQQDTIQILVLAFIAGIVLFRLYTTLGKRTGEEAQEPAPAQGEMPRAPAHTPAAPLASAGVAGIAAVERADPNFEPGYFLQGARAAYDLIVGAFAKGDREALRGLLTPRVYESYVAAIEAREAQGGVGPEIVRLKSVEIADAGMNGDTAQVVVKFEAELAEGATGVRDARERWTFERNVRSSDPNWLLSRVQAA
ncbi:MAG: Tim44/TimA family putative adaptor protein [Alphaproteobacteria bacterium]|nr:Tim44/TimA family putative adaptor protein [Alphaproteobacteria bacterium]